MKNDLGSQSLKEEQLTTIICSVEQLPKNRTLTVSSSDTANLEALTPNYLILGRPTIYSPKFVPIDGSTAMTKAFYAHSQFLKKI